VFTPKTVLQLFTARLPRRVLLWAFISILSVETLILLPSIIRRKDELLDQVAMTSKGISSTLAASSISQSEPQLLNHLRQLQQQQIIVGAALWDLRLNTSQTVGELPELSLGDLQTAIYQKKNGSNYRLDLAYPIQVKGRPYVLVLRHQTDQISQEVVAFIWRITGLVIIIAVVVTVTLSIVIASTVVQPILRLRDDLVRSGREITQDQAVSPFDSIRYPHRDELGEVIVAFQQMVREILQAISDRKASETALRDSSAQLSQTLATLNETQVRLIQTEKMASLGQLVAGIAHEVNNPVNFIHGNLSHVETHAQDLLELIQAYQQETPNPSAALQEQLSDLDLAFIQTDLPQLLTSMRNGSERIREIVRSFRNFSRLDEADQKRVDLHDGIDSALVLLQHRFAAHPAIQVVKQYSTLSPVECYPAQLNQVFFELLKNAIEALALREQQDVPLTITITTFEVESWVHITIADTGIGMTPETQQRAFDPFFTTKDVGQGKGLGLAIAHQIIVAGHQGTLDCKSEPQRGTDLVITLPLDLTILSSNHAVSSFQIKPANDSPINR
jgi:signal transduction histidine kinase